MDRLVNVPDAKAKSILLALCSDDSTLKQRALRFLDHMEALEHPSDHQGGTKRKAQSGIMICIQCQSPFYEEDNGDKACRYHNGYLEADSGAEVWADHDEDCHGPIDTDEHRVEFPEGFVWNCCGKLGYRGGCTRGKHDAHSGQRGKYGDTPGVYTSDIEESSSDAAQSSHKEESERDDDES